MNHFEMQLERQNVLEFNGRLGPDHFLAWLQSLEFYFTKYPLSEADKIEFASIKLIGDASQYWTDVIISRASKLQQPIQTWNAMKDQLKERYIPPSYFSQLLNQWYRLSQENLSVKDYVAKFDEFHIRCRDLSAESDVQIVSRFLNGLRHDLRTKLRTMENMKLERA